MLERGGVKNTQVFLVKLGVSNLYDVPVEMGWFEGNFLGGTPFQSTIRWENLQETLEHLGIGSKKFLEHQSKWRLS